MCRKSMLSSTKYDLSMMHLISSFIMFWVFARCITPLLLSGSIATTLPPIVSPLLSSDKGEVFERRGEIETSKRDDRTTPVMAIKDTDE